MQAQPDRRLYAPSELPGLLHLEEEQVEELLDTRQLPQILICGQPRIDSRDIDRMILTYKNTAARRVN